jgi:hypothetical protein
VIVVPPAYRVRSRYLKGGDNYQRHLLQQFCNFCLPFCQPCGSLDLSSHRCRFDRWLLAGRCRPAACAFAAGIPNEAAAPALLVPGVGTFPVRSPLASSDWPVAVLFALPVVELVFVGSCSRWS